MRVLTCALITTLNNSVGQEQSLISAAMLLQTSVLSFTTIAPLNVPPLLLLGSEAVTVSVLVLSVAQLTAVGTRTHMMPFMFPTTGTAAARHRPAHAGAPSRAVAAVAAWRA